MPFKKRYQKPYQQPPPSPIEISFWETAKPLIPELEKEVWIDRKYRVDFLIPSKKVIIELYGYQHHNTKVKITKDAERERYLQRVGYQVIRFTGTEVFKDVRKCVDEVLLLAKIEPAKILVKSIPTPLQPRNVTHPDEDVAAIKSLFEGIRVRSNQAALKQNSVNLPAANNMHMNQKKKLFSMETWQLIVLGVMVLVLVLIFLFFVSILF